jgi:hypothetical protein
LARRLSAIFQRSAPNCSIPVRWSAIIRLCSSLTFAPEASAGLIQRLQPPVFLNHQPNDGLASMLGYGYRFSTGAII